MRNNNSRHRPQSAAMIKNALPFFLEILKALLLNTSLAKFGALIFIQRLLSFGFYSLPLVMFKTDRLDLRGLDLGKNDIIYSLA